MKAQFLKLQKCNILTFALVLLVLLSSCIKKRTCKCYVNGVFSSTATTTRTTKKKAESQCASYSETVTNNNNVYVRECKLE